MNKIFQFNCCLTNGMNYFIAADPFALLEFKNQNHLSDNLLEEFTTNESGDKVIREGAMIALEDCEIVPHTIYINLDETDRILLAAQNDFQFKVGDYSLKIKSGIFCVFAISYLENFTEETIEKLVTLHCSKNYTIVDIENGWYSVEILAGLTQQNFEKSAYHWDEIMDDMEPTFELCLKKVDKAPELTATLDRNYKIEINKEIFKERRFLGG